MGSVSGRMFFSGGPVSLGPHEALPLSYYETIQVPAQRAMPGKVTFTGSPGRFVLSTNRAGWFKGQLPSGSYVAVGHSGLFQDGKLPCRGVQFVELERRAQIQVTASKATHVAVSCDGY
jgi:hypothetical protein